MDSGKNNAQYNELELGAGDGEDPVEEAPVVDCVAVLKKGVVLVEGPEVGDDIGVEADKG